MLLCVPPNCGQGEKVDLAKELSLFTSTNLSLRTLGATMPKEGLFTVLVGSLNIQTIKTVLKKMVQNQRMCPKLFDIILNAHSGVTALQAYLLFSLLFAFVYTFWLVFFYFFWLPQP